jgi:hypothetical protein
MKSINISNLTANLQMCFLSICLSNQETGTVLRSIPYFGSMFMECSTDHRMIFLHLAVHASFETTAPGR